MGVCKHKPQHDASTVGDGHTRITNENRLSPPYRHGNIFPKNQGFSLVEILIASALSVLLLSAMAKVFVSQQKLFQTEVDLADHFETKRLLHHLFRQAVSQAGYVGCAEKTNSGIEIFTVPPKPWPSWLSGSDILSVTSASPDLGKVLSVDLRTRKIMSEAGYAFKVGQWIVLSDCEHSETLQISRLERRSSILIMSFQAKINHQYETFATISPLIRTTWYLDQQGTLYEWRENDSPQAWVSGVEGLKIKKYPGLVEFNWRFKNEIFRTVVKT